ncbi:MAG: trypsin-like peptidase domain-containing protein [Acidobacteria bacterium]|nr:trypsin-like peptidase domain-containing protein [Acidobacteriota bacterium]
MRKLIILTFALLLAATSLVYNFPVQAQQVSEGQRLAMYSKPSVVRILDGYLGTLYWTRNGKTYRVSYVSSGSGSFIDPNGYIATNAHVTNTTHEGDDKGKDKLFIEFIKEIAQASNNDPNSILRNAPLVNLIYSEVQFQEIRHIHHVITPDGSVFPYEIKAFGAPIGDGKDVSIIKIELKNAPILKLGNSDKVQLQDHITVVGYPAAADTGLLDQKSALEASITDGKVSARKNSTDGAPVLQVSAPATHGNSGGPVLNDKGEVVGMLTFRGDTVNGQEVSGFSFVVPSSTISEFMKQAGATNEEGIVDKRYREGLELFWKGQYTPAIAKFEEVRRLFPQHSETERLIRDSQQAISEGKESTVGLGLIVMVGGLVLVLIVGGALVAFLAMRKKKSPSLPPAAYQQGGMQQGYPAQPSYPQQQPYQQPAPQPYQAQQSYPQQAAYPAANPQSYPQATPPAKTAVFAAPGAGTSPSQANYGAIAWTTGPLAGKRMEVRPEGFYIGRDSGSAQVVIEDPRVSSRHAWVGVRNGRVVLVDSGSTNGTFLNTIASGRIQEIALNPGDTIIVSEADVARFVYQS